MKTANQNSRAIPISVYRDLAGELRTTQARLAAAQSDRQYLAHQNQQLRQYIAQLAVSLQHIEGELANSSQFSPPSTTHSSSTARQTATITPTQRIDYLDKKNKAKLNGWFLAIATLLVMVTAFTGGLLVVRYWLGQQR